MDVIYFCDQTQLNCAGLQPYASYELRAACFNNMGSIASNWTAVSTLSEGNTFFSSPSIVPARQLKEALKLIQSFPDFCSLSPRQPPSMCLPSQWTAT